MSILTPRRFYLHKRLEAIRLGDDDAADVWLFKQLQTPWPALPADFPARSKLIAVGYFSVRDLDAADTKELKKLGLTRREADAVLLAMESYTMIPTVLKSPSVRMGNGEFAAFYDAPLFPSAAMTATTTGEVMEMGDLTTLRMTLDVTAASGTTPTLDVVIQTSPDGTTGWQTLGTFGQKTAVSSERNVFPGADRYVRAVATISGTTPSFTFSLTGDAL